MIFNANNLNSVLRNFGMGLPTGSSIDDLSSHFEGGFFNRETFDKSFAPDMDATAKKNLGDALNFGFGKNSKNYTEEALTNAGNAYRRNGQVGLGTFATPTHSSSQLMDLMGSSAMGAAFGGAAIGGIVGAAMGNDPGESAVFGGVAGAAMFGLGRGLRSGAFMESVERRAISSIMGKSHDELIADKQAVYRGRLEGEVERNREIVQRETQKSMNNEEKERLIRQQGTPEQKLIDEEARAFDQSREMGRNQFVGIDRRTNQPVTKQQFDSMPDKEKQFFYGVNDNLSREEYLKERQMSGGDFSTEEVGAISDIASSLNKQNTESIGKLIKNVGDDLDEVPQNIPQANVEKVDWKNLTKQDTPVISKPDASADDAFGNGNENIFNNTKALDVDSLNAKYKAKDTPHLDEMDSQAIDPVTSAKMDIDHYFQRENLKVQRQEEGAVENRRRKEAGLPERDYNERYYDEVHPDDFEMDFDQEELATHLTSPEKPGFVGQAEGELFFNDDLNQAPAHFKFEPKKIDANDSKQKIIPDGSEKEHVVKSRDGIPEELTGNESFDELARRLERVDINQTNKPLYDPDKTQVDATQEDVNFFNRQALLNFKPQTYAEHTKNMSAEELNAFEKQLADEQFAAHSEQVKAAGDDLSKVPELKPFNPAEAFGTPINPREALNKAYNSEYDTIIQSQKAAKEAEERYQKTASSMNVNPIGMDTIGLKKLDENGRVLPSIKLDYEKYPEQRELQSGSSLNRFNSENPQDGMDLIAEYQATQDQVQQNINKRGLTGEVSLQDRMNIRESEHEEGMGLIRNLFAHNQRFNRTRLQGPHEIQSIEFVNNGQTTRKLNDNETLIPIENSNYSFVGEKSDLNLSASAAIRMFDAQNVLRPKNFDNVSRPLANKELLQEAATAPTTSFMGKQAQKLLRSGPDHNIGMQTRHMVLGGSMLAGAAFGSKRKDHSRGFNSHRGNRI